MVEERAKIALITGGARGIGPQVCRRLGAAGFAVAVNFRSDEQAAQSLVDDLARDGVDAAPFQADVSDSGEASRLVDDVHRYFGLPTSVLINNVGNFVVSSVAEMSVSRWDETLASNLSSAFYVTRAALPAMRHQAYGRVVMVGLSPALELRGAPNLAAYAIAKTGVAVLARTLAAEEAAFGITVNCVAPGLIDNGHLPPQQARWMTKRVPAGRLGTGGDVAAAIGFLVSDEAAYIAGATLSVAGGWDWDNRPIDHDDEVSDVFAEPQATHGAAAKVTLA